MERVWFENSLVTGAEAVGAESSESFLLIGGALMDPPLHSGSILPIITVVIIIRHTLSISYVSGKCVEHFTTP